MRGFPTFAGALLILQAVAATPAARASPMSLKLTAVPRVNLSHSGPEVSRIALGILHLAQVGSVADASRVLEAAVAAGITTFDLADNYAGGKCLEWFGAAVKSLGSSWRKRVQLVAKIGEIDDGGYHAGGPLPWLDTGAAYTKNITDYYLDVIGTSYLDVLVYHWPDRLMDPVEVAATFQALRDDGKVRHFGVSNFKPLQYKLLAAATRAVGIPLVTNEVAVSPWTPQTLDDGTMEQAMLGSRDDGSDPLRPLAWGPLGGDPGGGVNFLFKKEWPSGSEEAVRQAQIRTMLQQVAAELNAELVAAAAATTATATTPGGTMGAITSPVTEDVVALAWTLKHPSGIVPIIGSMNATRIALQAGLAPQVAVRMTRKQWWEIADVSGVRVWGGPVPFVPPAAAAATPTVGYDY